MNLATRLRINTPNVANQIIDGEVIMINLKTGTYYSTDKIGALVWSLIEREATVGAILKEINLRYAGDSDEIEPALTHLVNDLCAESLIVIDETAQPETDSIAIESKPSGGADKLKFEAPLLQKYTDMQDLLLLDPIHEVDDAGWPVTKAEPLF